MKRILRIDLIDLLNYFMFIGAIFCYYFQFPIKVLSSFIVPFTIGFIILNIKHIITILCKNKEFVILYLIYILYLGIPIIVSILHFVDISRIIRFLSILTLIPLCFFVKFKKKQAYYNVFIFFSIIKSIIIIGLEIWCLKTGMWVYLRHITIPMGLGDIYPGNFGLMKIQIIGNPLLVLALILQFHNETKINFKTIILVIAIILAGNFAFILGITLFILYRLYKYIMSKKKTRKYYALFILPILSLIAILFINYSLSQIKEKSGYSNLIRLEQTKTLLNCNWIIGDGLGSFIKSNDKITKYNGNMYFELQSLYIFNQIGIIGLTLFYILTMYIAYKIDWKHKDVLTLYLLYLIYTFWNPYCFDVTHMLAVFLISNFGGIYKNGKKFSNSFLSK